MIFFFLLFSSSYFNLFYFILRKRSHIPSIIALLNFLSWFLILFMVSRSLIIHQLLFLIFLNRIVVLWVSLMVSLLMRSVTILYSLCMTYVLCVCKVVVVCGWFMYVMWCDCFSVFLDHHNPATYKGWSKIIVVLF